MKKFASTLIVCLLTTANAYPQNNISIKFVGLSIHPLGEDNAFLMPNKLDENAHLVVNYGGLISYEHFLHKDMFSVKVIQALYADCAARLGGISHIGLRGRILRKGKHSIYGGIGPTLLYRKNWEDLAGYENTGRFKGDVGDTWQYAFLWYGGEFEYNYLISDKIECSMNFTPGYPDLMSLTAGINILLE